MTSPPDLPGVTHLYHDLTTGVTAHVAHAGPQDGPPLLALHGFPQHFYAFRRLIDELGAEFRILAMDTRGLGWSGPAPDGDYRKARLAEDALALLEALEIERAGLVGHDWGAWVGFHAVLRAPERFTGFVAAGAAHPWPSAAATLREAPRFLYQPPIAAAILGPRIIPALVPRIVRAGWGDRATYDRAAEDVYARAYRNPARAEAASRYYRDFLRHEVLRNPTGRLTTPTRMLQGKEDPIGTRLAEGLDEHGDDARTELLEGCGHFVPEERPAELARAVREVC
ncbi:MAG TPA: alpha/beta hydrolase [Solirubrobacter sp.]|nr:alpha/beta hydrolase [Solirubrobacter sp.]